LGHWGGDFIHTELKKKSENREGKGTVEVKEEKLGGIIAAGREL